jgi:hypothetical protein
MACDGGILPKMSTMTHINLTSLAGAEQTAAFSSGLSV